MGGCALLFPNFTKSGAKVMLLTVFVFSGLLLHQDLMGIDTPCDCYGPASSSMNNWLPWPYRNGLLSVMLGIVLFFDKDRSDSRLTSN